MDIVLLLKLSGNVVLLDTTDSGPRTHLYTLRI